MAPRKGGSILVEDCSNESIGTSKASGGFAAQIEGSYETGSFTISNFKNTGNMSSDTYYGSGVVGYLSEFETVSISNCINEGDISGYDCAGGILGRVYGVRSTYWTMATCINSGVVKAIDSSNAGGLIGYGEVNGRIESCHNTGNVSTDRYNCGGIAGYFSGDIDCCYNTADVTCSGSDVGGIVGNMSSGNISNCYNSGNIQGKSCACGIVYGSSYAVSVNDCFNTGSVSVSTGWAACGIANAKNIKNCYNAGSVIDPTSYYAGAIGYGTFDNCYYLEGADSVSYGSTAVVGNVKTADEMKTDTFLELLKNSRTDTKWIRKDGEMPTLDI